MTSAELAKDKRLRAIYGITLEQQNAQRMAQYNACAICGRSFIAFTPFQDHFHGCCPRRLKKYCGKCNRSLLCFVCNKYVVGVLEKQKLPVIETCKKIIEYFEHWEPILRARGCYEAKPKAKKLRKKQKSVR